MFRKLSDKRSKFALILWFITFTLSFMFLSVVHSSASTQVTLEWSPNSEPDLAGYRVYYREEGQSYDYTNPSWEGVETTCTIYGIDETKTYYFVARAYDTEGFESSDSNEVLLDPVLPSPPGSGQVSLEWSPNTEPDLAGYRVFLREDGGTYDYASPSWEGVETTCTIYGIDETKTYYFVARAFDTEGFESGDSNEVRLDPTIPPDNLPPSANAGPDQTVDENQTVVLNGSNSTDPDDGIASYQWTQTGGPSITLSDAGGIQPTFIAPDVGPEGAALTFELMVIDYSGSQSTDMCVVNVTWLNTPPQANAGSDQTVSEGAQVTLDGSASLDIDDGIASYHWVQTGGLAVTLSDPYASQPTFTAPNVGPDGASMTFALTVTDTGGLQNSDVCIVSVSWQNEPPQAIVVDYIEAVEGAAVTLDGSGSIDPDDGIASYHWEQIEGTPVSLSDPGSVTPTFIAPETDANGINMVFRLTVTDFGGLQSSSDCYVYVTNTVQADNVAITSVTYNAKPKKLGIEAVSDAPKGSVILTAWANYGTQSVKLGSLRYSKKIKVYSNTFRGIDFLPDTVTVKSTGGGSDTEQCLIK